MELIDIDQNEIVIGENESQYIRESVDKDFLTELSGLEFNKSKNIISSKFR